jgi:hypothetical protein
MATLKRVQQIKEHVLPKYEGRIDLDSGKILKLKSDEPITSFHSRAGYYTITVRIDGKPINFFQHEVIAVASGLDIVGKTVNHKNEIKTDNRPENLEPLSRGDNLRDYWKDKTRKTSLEMKEEMRQLRSEGMSYQKIGDKFGVSHTTVQRLLKGRTDRNGWNELYKGEKC